MGKAFINEQRKLVVSNMNSTRSIEIGDAAIDCGFLLQFPGVTLPIFLYLVTHMDDNYQIRTCPTIISTYLPDSYKVEEIYAGLSYLKNNGIIDCTGEREGDYTYLIQLNIDKIQQAGALPAGSKTGLHNDYFNNRELRMKILQLPQPCRAELFQAILTFISPAEDLNILESKINQWLEDFPLEMIRELIRRVDKWQEKYNNPAEKAFHYLKGIIDDWYRKEIHSYEDLQKQDRLFREIKEIAQLYGLAQWQNISPVQVETFQNWLQEDYPLSVEVVKLAIQEAFRRKKDGQPSLQYIEDNFIKLLKENQIRDTREARGLFKKTRPKRRQEDRFSFDWDKLAWDFED
ncbi:MAG TPA: DnaD domain protein [Halanaerobiales bacterium]|nr:DnaD domain protein [Halanaerobiales bacterium]